MSQQNDQSEQYLVQLDLGSNGGPVRWKSQIDAVEWIQTELKFWEWLKDANTKREIVDPLNGLRNQARRLSEDPGIAGAIAELLKQLFVSKKIPHSSTLLANAIARWAATDVKGATVRNATTLAPGQNC